VLKKIFAILITLIILIPYITTFGVVTDFVINQDYIAKVLCINKERPKLNCDGKCYLAQKLKNTPDQNNNQLPESFKNLKLEILHFYSEVNAFNLNSTKHTSQKTENYFRNKLFPIDYTFKVFHPPQSDLIRI